MEFNQNKPIYLQIADNILERILTGSLKPHERVLSVRELGAEIGVNPNTIMKSYEKLTADGIIYNKRGLGYFVSEGAREKVVEKLRSEFLEFELPQIRKKMELLQIDPSLLH